MTPPIDPTSVIEALARAPGLIVPLVREAPPELLERRPATGRWSIHEHACHLAEVHPLFFKRLDRMLTWDHPPIEPYFPDQDEAADLLLSRDLDEALERFVVDRTRLLECLRELSPDQWRRTGEHPEYRHYSLFVMFRHLALHDLFHAYRIETLALAKTAF